MIMDLNGLAKKADRYAALKVCPNTNGKPKTAYEKKAIRELAHDLWSFVVELENSYLDDHNLR